MKYSVLGDWGTSRMRLFRVVDGAVVDRREGPGIGALHTSAADALLEALSPWRAQGEPEKILLCGMAGARGGLAEAPYVECPVEAARWAHSARRLELDGLRIAIAAGLACTRSDGAPDVMRGEETQVFGALRLAPALAQGRQLIALPGTHGKWAWLDAGRIIAFQTFVAGELFALLRDHSTLARVGSDPAGEPDGYADGLATARRGGGLLGNLFPARSAQLRAGRPHGWALGYLSGLVIGTEVGDVLAQHPAHEAITLVGDPALAARYRQALGSHGVDAGFQDGDACALAGLHLFEETLA